MRIAMQGEAPRPRPLIYSDDNEFTTARVVVQGDVAGVGFEEFLASYITRLDLKFEPESVQDDRLGFVISGKPELVDMLITVCWLGPGRALVMRLETEFLENHSWSS